jgi:DNA-binding NarL/FixJ family response regulator
MSDVQPARILIADDHPIFRDGLRRLIEREPGLTIVGEADNGPDAVRAAAALRPDLVLLDVAMPGLSGLEVLEQIAPPARVLLLTAEISQASLARALRAGARGIVLKDAGTRQLIEAIGRVMAGKFFLGGGAVDTVAEALAGSAAAPRARLTPREREIVQSIVDGQSNRDIAARLGISVQTVKHHLTSIFDKTGASTRLELALFAINHGITD